MRARPAAFLDRDGVLNERPPAHDYVRDVSGLRIVPEAPLAVRRLRDVGYVPIVVSNQRGVGRGLVSLETLHVIERALQLQLDREGARIEAFYYCPHLASDGCQCRKPAPGMLVSAAAEHGLDLARSVMIGDSQADIDAGHAAGTRAILLAHSACQTDADAVTAGLGEAAEIAARWASSNHLGSRA